MNVGDTWLVTDPEQMARLRYGDVVEVGVRGGGSRTYRVMYVSSVDLPRYSGENVGAGIKLAPDGPSDNTFGFLPGDRITLVEKADA